MTDPSFPVLLVAPDGAAAQADSAAELAQLSVRGYRLRRAVDGVNLAVATGAGTDSPREITLRREAPALTADTATAGDEVEKLAGQLDELALTTAVEQEPAKTPRRPRPARAKQQES